MHGQEMLKQRNWAVVGDVLNQNKFAAIIKERLIKNNYRVFPVNPRSKSEEVYKSLKEINGDIDVIDLCINPKTGLEIVREAHELGIKKIFIQPGAGSEDIIKFCQEQGMDVFEGCVLVELGKLPAK